MYRVLAKASWQGAAPSFFYGAPCFRPASHLRSHAFSHCAHMAAMNRRKERLLITAFLTLDKAMAYEYHDIFGCIILYS